MKKLPLFLVALIILSPLAGRATGILGSSGNTTALNKDLVGYFPSPSGIALSSMTLSAWVYIPDSLPSSWATILEYDRNGPNWYGLWKSGNGPFFSFRQVSGDGNGIDFKTTIVPNNWYHVVGVYDASNNTFGEYLNGALDNSGAGNGAPTPTSGALTIGKSDIGEDFPGTIVDVRIYNHALSAQEISQLYHKGHH